MTVLSAQTISLHNDIWSQNSGVRDPSAPGKVDYLRIEPFFKDKQLEGGLSYGLTAAGYDIRVGEIEGMDEDMDALTIWSGGFLLMSSLERLYIPRNIIAFVHDKSTWARRGIALQNTVLEPGWKGHITLEVTNHGLDFIQVRRGTPIAQVVFHYLDAPTDRPYRGKYQNQEATPVKAIFETASKEPS